MKLVFYLLLIACLLFPQLSSCQCLSDTIAPTILGQNINIYLDQQGWVFISGVELDSASFDNCGIESYLINGQKLDTLDCSNLGSNSVIFSIVDSAGNQSNVNVLVTVNDTLSPSIVCMNNIQVFLDSNGYSTLAAPELIVLHTDNCNIVSFLVNNLAVDTFDCLNIGGAFFAVVTALDDSGNSATCISSIDVQDTLASCFLSLDKKINKLTDVLVFPNPATGDIFIDAGQDEIREILVRNLSGQLFRKEEKLYKTFSKLNLEKLPNSIYILSIKTEKGITHKQVLLRR